jgi:hypothetical protein
MADLKQALKLLKQYATWAKLPLPAMERYLHTGDEAALAQVKAAQSTNSYWAWGLADAIAAPAALTEEDYRILRLLAASKAWAGIGHWLNRALAREKPDEDYHAILRKELQGVPARTVADLTVEHVLTLERNGQPTSAGRYLLALTDKDQSHLAKKFRAHQAGLRWLDLLLKHAPERVPPLTEELLQPDARNMELDGVCGLLLRRGGERYEDQVAATCRALPEPWLQFRVIQKLYEYNPTRYRAEALAISRAALAAPEHKTRHDLVGDWMVQQFGREVLDDLAAFLRHTFKGSWHQRQVLAALVKALGRDAVPAIVAALEGGDSELKLEAVGHLITLTPDGSQDALIEATLAAGLQRAQGAPVYQQQRDLLRMIGLASRWRPRPLAEHLWALLQDKSKPVRDAVARALGKVGEEVLPQARELLEARRGDTRMAAVTILSTLGTPAALAALEARLDLETDEGVRDAMLLALEAAWAASGRKITRTDVEARVARTAPKLKTLPVSWLKEALLPPLYFRDGSPLDASWVRYLLYRQSRAGAVRADVEARPLLELLDRQRSSDFALEVLKGFLGSRMSSEDRGLLALAALLGDDRLVPLLGSQIRQWADGTRGKLAEYGVQALALLGTDAALLTVDALSIRYRTKKKNVGQAAVDAFAAAAERLGLTTDELGDRVVPWLGFEPGKQRLIDCGGRRFEMRIGPDFKLKYVDLEKNKPVASLPKSAPKEVLAAVKEQSATLREVVKAQLLRLENLLVRQHRWPVTRWRELFLNHPVLLPFAVRLVWGAYDAAGRLTATFRALEDRSLTDVNDNAVTLPEGGTIGMAHPLEVSEDVRQTWRAHLADYEVEPPFPQFERPVVTPKPDQRGQKVYGDLAGTGINAMTFRGRAEKLGWHRGSVCDGGGVTSYVKSFPLAGVDVFVELEGLYIGIGMEEEIKLQNIYFVRSGSVKTGGYTYDEPSGDNDPRLVAFGDVPPVVFSEAMGDLGKIAPPKTAAPEAVAGG